MTRAWSSEKPRRAEGWWFGVALLLVAWGLRLCLLDAVPPGWRDDELINIYTLAGEVLQGNYPMYFTGASGHEPLYHYLQAAVHGVLGVNVLSGHLLSAAFGTLSVALTHGLARRLFGRRIAAVASLALAASFWSLMYSRFALRHISSVFFALLTFYLLWQVLDQPAPSLKAYAPLGLVVGVGLYTYFAARLIPVILAGFGVYLALFDRSSFRRHWRGLLFALAISVLVAVPLALAVGGADARVMELAAPLQALRQGELRPVVEGVVTTLGMFHTTGDPEWLYNIPDRPLLNGLGALALWAGVALSLWRWRQPRYFFLLLWFLIGLSPAFISTPSASLSHTIISQPVTYILVAAALLEGVKAASRLGARVLSGRRGAAASVSVLVWSLCGAVLLSNVYRDQRDYFVMWPSQDMVRFLYRADYRDAARYLDDHPEMSDFAIGSTLLGPWDRLALDADTQRTDRGGRFFNPERALVLVGAEEPGSVFLTMFPNPQPPLDALVNRLERWTVSVTDHVTLRGLLPLTGRLPISDQASAISAQFANGLALTSAGWIADPAYNLGSQAVLLTAWQVTAPLDLPAIPVVANPPPPGVYAGPRLAVFTHLQAADGSLLASDDGLWVDPVTLELGDQFVQVHRFDVPPDADVTGGILQLGLYDPMTGDRWKVVAPSGGDLGACVVIGVGDGQ
ncbi:MAG: phospholipid carrier-dependent glycosyltransferase [Anaerolineales bacterium]|nr:phospholipid carrier-dependent glycosyltransferase [Anaerolineales bacterium]